MAAGCGRARRGLDGEPGDAATRSGVRCLSLGLHGRPAIAGPDSQAADHTRPPATGITCRHGPALRARRSRPGQHVGPGLDRTGRPVLRRRHDLGQQRHGVRALPHPAARVDQRPLRGPAPRTGGAHDVRHPDTERAGTGDARRDGSGQFGDRRADTPGRAGYGGRPRRHGARREATGRARGQRRWGRRCVRRWPVAR